VIAQVALQLGILATGNYTYFNWLTIALCIPFLDDSHAIFRRLRKPPSPTPQTRWRTLVPASVLACASVFFTFDGFRGAFAGLAGQQEEMRRYREEYARTGRGPSLAWHQVLRSFNGYGLFRTMTLTRPEIVLEGSADGVNWHEYEFPHKAGDLYRRPTLVAPHQPRLDWQMWFAALGPGQYGYLLERLMKRVLEGEPTVLALLEKNPFPDQAPRCVRLVFYDYRFTRFEDHTAAWWKRELRGMTKPVLLESFQPRAGGP
jgi:hypothetical protein